MKKPVTKHDIEQVTRQPADLDKTKRKSFANAPLKWDVVQLLLDLWGSKHPVKYSFHQLIEANLDHNDRQRYQSHDREVITLNRGLGFLKIHKASENPYVVYLTLTPLGRKFCTKLFRHPANLAYLWKTSRFIGFVCDFFTALTVVLAGYVLFMSLWTHDVKHEINITFARGWYTDLGVFAVAFVSGAVTLIGSWICHHSTQISRKDVLDYVLSHRKGHADKTDVLALYLSTDSLFGTNKK